ncbi:hypothetical protein BKA64DRAFT_705748 [Cadophora sp. MPI-SDFR-AT-0126]|nr:hypothetical protein BKA64DRAFT_705748 [Leotiomycetes sp. MPI-SDFR-AT-0126]
MGGEVEKGKRKPHLKRTSGCITCKSRHVKCDEAKPACLRCRTGGFTCGGYITAPSKFEQTVAVCRPNLLPKPATRIIQSSVRQFRGTTQDQRAFDFFRSVTAPILDCHFDEDFWNYFLLQMSQAESTVWHSVLALGTLHEQGSLDDEDLRALHHRNGLNHYNKAIAGLTKSTDAESQSAEAVLVSCIVFVCVEIVLGNIKEAMSHLQGGIRIIRSLDTPGSLPSFYQSSGQLIKTNVVPIFHHFNDQSFVYGRTPMPAIEKFLNRDDDVPTTFADCREARSLHTQLLSTAQHFAVKTIHPPDQGSDAYARLLLERHNLQSNIHRWSTASEQLISSSRLTKDECSKISQMKGSHRMAMIWTFNALNTDEMSFDALVHDFDAVVRQSRMNLNKCCEFVEKPEVSKPTKNFLQLQSISPQFVAATKCRNPAIRRRALTLLQRSPLNQGFWDAKKVVRVVERIIELEEEGLEDLRDPTGMIVPSEWARIQAVSVNLDKCDVNTMMLVFERKFSVIEELWSRD